MWNIINRKRQKCRKKRTILSSRDFTIITSEWERNGCLLPAGRHATVITTCGEGNLCVCVCVDSWMSVWVAFHARAACLGGCKSASGPVRLSIKACAKNQSWAVCMSTYYHLLLFVCLQTGMLQIFKRFLCTVSPVGAGSWRTEHK